MQHDAEGLDALLGAPGTRLYLRPTGFVDGPFHDPAAVRRLAGGAVWFSAVQVIVRHQGRRRASLLLPVQVAAVRFADHPLWQALVSPRPPLTLGAASLPMDQAHIMGILNLTPDSFSDGGRYTEPAAALARAAELAAAGAAIIDVGAESTRPGAAPVSAAEELARLEPVLTPLCAHIPVSLDTRRASVMQMGLASGVAMINDVSALTYDTASLPLLAEAACPIVLMHMTGEPATMLSTAAYEDVLLDVFDALEARIIACEAAGIARARLILDPGIGFGKRLRHNLDVINGLALLHGLGCPILLGVSRKRMIGALSKEEAPEERLPGSLALALAGLEQGVQLLRVWRGLRDAAQAPPSWLD
jgi:dihydropteroate synthase